MNDVRDRLRKVIAPVALVLALAALGHNTCASEMAETTIVVPARGAARVDLELLRPGGSERLGFFSGAPVGGQVRWPLQVDPGTYDVAITVHLPNRIVSTRRTLQLRDRAVVEVALP